MKRLIVLLWFVFVMLGLQANNVRIVEDVKLGEINNGVAEVTFKIAWDNSWRDDYNWDAVYVFMKTKRTTDLEWTHAYFFDDNNAVSSGYECWPGRWTTSANYRQGVFIYRNSKGKGDAEVTATLRWNTGIPQYTENELQSGAIEMSLQCIEMVYVPQGAYYLGDGASKNSLRKKLRQILPEWDLIDSRDKTQKYKASSRYTGNAYSYSVSGPANRVCEGREHTGVATGNVYFTAAGNNAFWQVEFAEPKTVRYFGVSGLYGHTNYRPSTWQLEASRDGVNNWTPISETYGADEWMCERLSYPVYNALPVNKVDSFRFFRIYIPSAPNGAVINNVALTEKDLSMLSDDGYAVDGQTIPMDNITGLFADDGDSWSGNITGSLDVNGSRITSNIYPNGFEGFYAMKYEISQEQYVRFLNKLNATQQKARTRDDLDQLPEGAYVFGSNLQSPSCRNGIVVGARSNGVVIFACNLTADGEGKVSQEDDGQTLACNYLTVNDMLAYADWAGLRPLSEMEYEKMGRRPYPQTPGLKGWAGGDRLQAEFPTSETFANGTTPGGEDERLADGNVNAGGNVSGPVRVGSYASNANFPVEAGASYWGLMDLSGNLAEYYYNVGSVGRTFREQYYGASQGNGVLAATGEADISTSYWPRDARAFALRGGSFESEVSGVTEGEIAISDRSKALGVSSLIYRDSTATFRLGHSYTYLSYGRTASYNSYLTLENGLNNQSAQVVDSVCVGSTYTIRGSELLNAEGTPVDGGGKTTYIWYMQESDVSNMWRIIPNENGRDLVLTDIRSDRLDVVYSGERFQPFYVRREAIAPNGACHVTRPVTIYRINPYYSLSRLVDTLRQDNSALGFLLKTGTETTVKWRWKAAGDDASNLGLQTNTSTVNWYMPKRSDFNNIAGQNHVVVCDINFFNKCPKRQEVTVFVEKRLEVGIASNDITLGGNDPSKECGVLMQDMRSQSSSRVYKTVKINGKCWMAENLRYDGVPNGIKSDDPSGAKYGRLYQYNDVVVNNACPSGWRLPTYAEMESLVSYLGGEQYAGKKAKAGNYWAYADGITQENTVGLSALGVADGQNNVNTGNYFFMVTSDNRYYQMNYNNDQFKWVGWWNSYYMTIRCIKR